MHSWYWNNLKVFKIKEKDFGISEGNKLSCMFKRKQQKKVKEAWDNAVIENIVK